MKLKLTLVTISIFLFSSSCDDGLGGLTDPPKECDWGKEESVSFDKVNLRVPGGMNQWWNGIFPTDNVIRDLWLVMDTNGDYTSKNIAKVWGTVTGGQGCVGIKNFSHNNGSSKITTKSVKAPFPNNGFIVEAKVNVRSDDFTNNGFSGGPAYYVLWTRTGKVEPGGSLNGNILGTKEAYDPNSGKIYGKGYVISGGTKNYY